MRLLVVLLLLFSSSIASGQRSYLFGMIKDGTSDVQLTDAHVRNISAGRLTSTNERGIFRLPGKVGDTMVVSNVGYKTKTWVVDKTWFQGTTKELFLMPRITYLDEVIVGEFPEYEQFKELIIETQPRDTSFQVFGVPRVVMDEYPQLEKAEYLNPVFVFFHPVSAIHHSVSKKEKEKRKMQQIRKRSNLTSRAYAKFTRKWVAENTQLSGDKLTSFIAYCDFSTPYLASASLFDIQQRMMELLPQFLAVYDKG